MGNNAAYTDLEAIVVGIYDLGKLDSEVLKVILSAFSRYGDIDSGGSQDLVSHDGKDMQRIIVEVMDPEFKPVPAPDQPDWDEDDENDAWYYRYCEILEESGE